MSLSDDLAVGQVWELIFNDEMVPAMLLFHIESGIPGGDKLWRCLSLYNGMVFSASIVRWENKKIWNNTLVGERIA